MLIGYKTKKGTSIEYDDLKDEVRITPATVAHVMIFDRAELADILQSIEQHVLPESYRG